MTTYDKLIGRDGQPTYGRFPRPIAEINHRDFLYFTPLDQKAGPIARHFHLKQFQFVGLMSERYLMGCAIVSLKYASNAFVWLYDRQTHQIQEKSLLQPLSLGCRMSNQPDGGLHRFHKGNTEFNFHSRAGKKHIEIFSGQNIHIDITIEEPAGFQPIAVCTRTGYNGWTYTQKANALRANGHIHWQNQRIEVEENRFLGSYDWSCGYMRRQTAWNWASLSGFLPDGRTLGLNLANGVNETGHTENGFWLNGELVPLGPVNFEFNKQNRNAPWRIHDESGQIKLRFLPESQRCEKLNLGLVASNFTQLAGTFGGTLKKTGQPDIQLQHIPGFCEDHYAKW